MSVFNIYEKGTAYNIVWCGFAFDFRFVYALHCIYKAKFIYRCFRTIIHAHMEYNCVYAIGVINWILFKKVCFQTDLKLQVHTHALDIPES